MAESTPSAKNQNSRPRGSGSPQRQQGGGNSRRQASRRPRTLTRPGSVKVHEERTATLADIKPENDEQSPQQDDSNQSLDNNNTNNSVYDPESDARPRATHDQPEQKPAAGSEPAPHPDHPNNQHPAAAPASGDGGQDGLNGEPADPQGKGTENEQSGSNAPNVNGDQNNIAPSGDLYKNQPVYDPDSQEPTDPNLKDLEEDQKDDEENEDDEPDAAPAENLAAAEKKAAGDKSFYTPEEEVAKNSAKTGFFTKKRTAIGGGILGGGILGTIAIFTFLSGAGVFLHLDQALQRNFLDSQNTTNIRINRLIRFARTGNIGETRVGFVGTRVFGSYITQLKDIGVEFQTTRLGAVRSATVDTAKLQKRFPELKNMSFEDQKAFVAKTFNIDQGQVIKISGVNSETAGGFKFGINARDFGVGATRALINNSLAILDNGKIVSGIMLRFAAGYYDAPSLWHPIKRLKAASSKKTDVTTKRATEAAAKEAEQERVKNLVKPTTETGATARTRVKKALKDNEGKVTVVLAAQAGLCLVRSIANDAITVNRTAVVLPPAIQAADKMAVGEEVKSGTSDLDPVALGAVASTFSDSKGQTIFDSAPMQATEGVVNPTGPDLPGELSQAYYGKTTADSIKKYVTIKKFGVNFTSAACSKFGLAVGAVVGVAALVSGAFTFGGSTAAYLSIKAGEAAATAGVLYMLQKELTPLVEDKGIVPDVLSGPLGGSLLAFGARELANIGAVASGGIALVGSETSTVSAAVQQQQDQEYNSESTYAKLFDTNDYRSLASRALSNFTPSFTQNLSNMATAVFHVGNLFSSLGQMFSGKAFADPKPYNWGFPRYGIPDSIATNDAYGDPYANADAVAKILDGKDGNDYISKASKCFGVKINKDDQGLWQVLPDHDINPSSSDYTEADCGNLTPNWQRMMLFVFDSRAMDAIGCYAGDDNDPTTQQSCTNAGVSASPQPNQTTDSGSTAGAGSDAGTTAAVSGSSQQLAQQILDNKNIDLSSYTSSPLEDVKDAAAGKVGTAGVPTSNAILQLIATIGKQHRVMITAIQSNGQGHCNNTPKSGCPGDPHYTGDAVDFGSLDGHSLSGRDSGSIDIMKIAFSALPTSAGFGQSNCGSTPELPAGDTTFPDTCNHLHVQVLQGTP